MDRMNTFEKSAALSGSALQKTGSVGIFSALLFVSLYVNGASLPDQFEMNDLVSVAVTQSPVVKSSQSSLQAFVAAKEEADWNRYPSVGVQSERRFATSNTSSDSGTPVLLQITQPVWTGGAADGPA